MSPFERKQMIILTDTIQGEINRMCVTKDLEELDTMALYAIKNIEKLKIIRFANFERGETDERRKSM